MTKARIEKAEELLMLWAFQKHTGRKEIEYSGGYTGDSPISGIEYVSPAFNPVGLNTKITHATATRNQSKSKLPLGGYAGGRKRSELFALVDVIIGTYTKRQQEFLLGVYLPASCYGLTKRPSDAKIARIFGLKPAYACRIKGKLIEDIVRHAFEPHNTGQTVNV